MKFCVCLLVSEGKSLKDESTLESLELGNNGKLYFKDLGPQVGWSTVSFNIGKSIVKHPTLTIDRKYIFMKDFL